MKRKKKMTMKDIPATLKTMLFVIPGFWAILSVAVSITWLGGQTTEQIKTTVERVDKLDVWMEDSIKQKEQTAVDVNVLKTEMKNLNEKVQKMDDKLDKIIDKLSNP